MSLTVDEGKSLVTDFCKSYPSALQVRYKIRSTQEELFNAKETIEAAGKIFGAYFPASNIAGFATSNFSNENEFKDTLRHEILGHFGLNTFNAEEKRLIVTAIASAKDQPGLAELWANVDSWYPNTPELLKAEEVYAFACEAINPNDLVNTARGEKSLREVCFDQTRPMQLNDLINITNLVADGMRQGVRHQQNFPLTDQEQFKRDADMEPKKPFHEVVAENLIKKLETNTAPWQKPWEPGQSGFMPINPTTGNRYKGINSIQLMSQGHDDNRWMTYKQAEAVGAQVRKGEKGTPVQYWKFSEEKNKLDVQGKPVLDGNNKPLKEVVQFERPRVFMATVFNAEQIDGLPPLQIKEPVKAWEANERAEKILAASGANINHSDSNRAFYRPPTDSIHIPAKHQFPNDGNYYATVLHELGHWTGHETRLNRDLGNPFGSEAYAKEELRAEIASMILGDEIGIGHDPEKHVSYVKSWINVLKQDPTEIFRAAADAEKIRGFVMSLEQKQELTNQTPDYHKQALDYLGHHYGLSELTAEHTAFLNNASQVGDAPIVGAIELAESFKLQLTTEGINYAVAQTLAHNKDEILKDQSGQEQESLSMATPSPVENRKDAEMNAILNDSELQKEITETENRYKELAVEVNSQPAKNTATEIAYIRVPYTEKEAVKALGAKWDRKEQSWYIPPGMNLEPFAKWTQNTSKIAPVAISEPNQGQPRTLTQNTSERVYLAVPYGEREAAKLAGAQWDKTAKSWYIGDNPDSELIKRWLPENVTAQQGPAKTPQEEFADALRSVGCIVPSSSDHPMMDGKKHRIETNGDKNGEKSGFYVGHLDGHPAGYIKNNKTNVDIRWKSKGYSLSEEDKAKLNAEAATKLAQRDANLERTQQQTSTRIENQMASLVPITQPTPYLADKGIQAHAGALTDAEGKTTFIPAQDINGKVWTLQYISDDGTKRFAKDSKKEGCFHVVGGMDALAKAPAIVVGEGYATATTASESLGFATVAAFDSGNLSKVVKDLHEKFPDKPVIVIGDDDRHLSMTQGVNVGKEKAIAAANEVGGKAIFPVFTPKEQSYPAELPPITPEKYRKNEISTEQRDALAIIKKFTDFNDLSTKSELGKEGVHRQLNTAVSKVIEDTITHRESQALEASRKAPGAKLVKEQKVTRKRSSKIA